MLRVLILSTLILAVSKAQTEVKQCTCQQIEPCLKADAEAFFKCGDECQHHTTALSFNYDAARKCFEQIREPMTKAIDCYHKTYEKTCATGEPQMVPKRDFEFFKLALYSRLDKMLEQAGVLNQVLEFTKTSRKFTGCQMHCLAKISPVGCQEKNHCGLNEPSDEAIVDSMVQCSIRNGVNTEAIRNLCRCLAQAGNSQIASACEKLVVQ